MYHIILPKDTLELSEKFQSCIKAIVGSMTNLYESSEMSTFFIRDIPGNASFPLNTEVCNKAVSPIFYIVENASEPVV